MVPGFGSGAWWAKEEDGETQTGVVVAAVQNTPTMISFLLCHL
jgi:hypothetical protein